MPPPDGKPFRVQNPKKELTKILAAVLVGALFTTGVFAVLEAQDPDPPSPTVRVIAEGRFAQATAEMESTIRQLVEARTGVEVPTIEGAEPCAGISDSELRDLCVGGLASGD